LQDGAVRGITRLPLSTHHPSLITVLGIIGGSGLGALANLEITRRRIVRTPYGEPSCALTFGTLRRREIVFLARHGYGHTIPPHQVNYRANLWALHAQQVQRVVAIASVGGIRADLLPGALVVPHQILDYTHGREATFSTGAEGRVMHIDFTHPYCEELRSSVLEAAAAAGCPALDGATYAATQGPRLETAAEIDRLERDGADIVGMTGMPEAALARELGLCYAALAVVVNPAAGRGTSAAGVRMEDINTFSKIAMENVRRILERLVEIDGG
jgi:5'-deoxy-5'-methylthioadenosine phosphorylase